MNQFEKGIKIIFKDPFFDFPFWLKERERKEYVILCENTSSEDSDLFLITLFGYNDICFGNCAKNGFSNVISYFYEQEGLAMNGGILFFDKEKKIFPSCCCGLEDWREVQESIFNKKSPWLGHNPFPVFEYEKETVYVWSDDCIGMYGEKQPKDKLICLNYSIGFLKEQLLRVEKDLYKFITIPLYKRVKELESSIADSFIEVMLEWLLNKQK